MARFVFELEGVLRQRVHVERQQQARVAEVDRMRLALEAQLRALHGQITGERAHLAALLADGSFAQVRAQALAINAMERRAQALACELGGVLRRLEEERRVLAQRSAERRAIELLREERFEAWRREQQRIEQRVLDDIAGIRFSEEAA